jgi:hypothetical protein
LSTNRELPATSSSATSRAHDRFQGHFANCVAPRPEGYGLPFGEAKKAGALWLDQGDASRNPVLISWKDKGSDLSYIRDVLVIKDTATDRSHSRIELVITYQIGAREFLLEEFQYFVAVQSAQEAEEDGQLRVHGMAQHFWG